MKPIILITLLFFNLGITIAQTTDQGKITYEMLKGGDINNKSIIDMWFTKDRYMYEIRVKDFRETYEYRSKKNSNNLTDSMGFERTVDRINEKNKQLPHRYIYGNLSSFYTYQTEIKSNLQPVCVRDTFAIFIEWELQTDTMTINKLRCQKATGKSNGMNYIAWYVPSIPVSVAPLQLRGLPGLLIELKNMTNNTTISMRELEWPAKANANISPCNNTETITRNDFNKLSAQSAEDYQKKLKEAKTVGELMGILKN